MKKQLFTLIVCLLTATWSQAQPTLISSIPTASTNFTKVQSKIFFTSKDSLWVMDESLGGVNFVKAGLTNPGKLFEANGLLYFVVSGNQLWRSNGTSSGTFVLKNFSIGAIKYVHTSGTLLYFTAAETATGTELYRTDGTAGGTILLKDINSGSGDGVDSDASYLEAGGYIYFPATTAAEGTELWRTDGTTAGTLLLKDVNPGAASGYVKGAWAALGSVYFAADDGTHGVELWITDGTGAGTGLLKDVNTGAGNGFASDTIIEAGSVLYFFANETNTQFELWKSDGTNSGTELVKQIDLDKFLSAGKGFLYADNSNVYFYTFEEAYPELKLWKSDGTLSGTVSYHTISREFDSFRGKAVINSRFISAFFSSGDRAHILVTDGTAAGSFIMDILYTGDTYVFHFNVVEDHVIVGATGQNDYFLGYFKSDGTQGGTSVFYSDKFNRPSELAVVGNKIFFNQDLVNDPYGITSPEQYKQLFISDLTNTNSLQSLYGNSMEGSANLISINGVLYYTTYNDYQFTPPSQDHTIKKLWKFDPAVTTCTSEGGILQQVWNGIGGTSITDIPIGSVVPSSISTIGIFEGATNVGDSYGARYRGYLCVPETGAYTFYISSNDNSELWLSTDALPENKVKIAYVNGFTGSREWDKYPSQQSVPINLVAGRSYYIEALHKEGVGTDNLAVGWKLPDGTYERPIPGSRLSPYKNERPGIGITRPVQNQVFIGPDYITLEAQANDWDGSLVKVEFYADNVKIGDATPIPFSDGFFRIKWSTVALGAHTLTAKAYDDDGGVTTTSINIYAKSDTLNNSFTLLNADTDQDIRVMSKEGEVIFLSNHSINIRYNATQSPGSVKFLLNGAPYSAENVAPYSLAGDQSGNYNAWTTVTEGSYTLEAREFSGSGGTGTLLKSNIIHFNVVKPDGNLPPVVNAGPNLTIQLPQNSVPLAGTAYDPDGSINFVWWSLISAPSDVSPVLNISLGYTGVLDTARNLTVPGDYVFRLTARDNSNVSASDEMIVTVTSPTSFVVSHFTLVDAETGQTEYTLYPGSNVNTVNSPNYKYAIVAHTYPSTVGSVYLDFDGYTRTENVAPYSLFGDTNGEFNSSPIAAGTHTITATPYSGSNKTGIQGPPLSVTFNMARTSLRTSTVEENETSVICYPNPSGGNVNIQLTSDKDGYGKVELYDVMGRLKETLYEGNLIQGQQLEMLWNGSDESRGMYFLNTTINNKSEVQKIILK